MGTPECNDIERSSRTDTDHAEDPAILCGTKYLFPRQVVLGRPLKPTPSVLIAEASADDDEDPSATPSPATLTPRGTRPLVHFRSRVRIASGLHRHHRSTHNGPASSASSRSASFSSSISAPLRTNPGLSKSGWSPLGQRVNVIAYQKKYLGASAGDAKRERRRKRLGLPPLNQPNERSRLLGSDGFAQTDYDEGDIGAEGDRLGREIDHVFGQWPWRLLNHHVSPFEFRPSRGVVLTWRLHLSGGGGIWNQFSVAMSAQMILMARNSPNTAVLVYAVETDVVTLYIYYCANDDDSYIYS